MLDVGEGVEVVLVLKVCGKKKVVLLLLLPLAGEEVVAEPDGEECLLDVDEAIVAGNKCVRVKAVVKPRNVCRSCALYAART